MAPTGYATLLAAALLAALIVVGAQLDPCNPPCQNSSTCKADANSEVTGGYFCDCLSGYAGADCSQRVGTGKQPIAVCDPICKNYGICQEAQGQPGTYTCSCSSGFSGPDCSVSASPPAPLPQAATSEALSPCNPACQNNGTCTAAPDTEVSQGSYFCDCKLGFTGWDCSQRVASPTPPSPTTSTSPARSLCNPPCQNNGTCTAAPDTEVSQGSHVCNCKPGFTGWDCSQHVASPNPPSPPTSTSPAYSLCSPACQNGGVCQEDINSRGSYICSCTAGFTGSDCSTEQAASPDAGQVCLPACRNGGICAEAVDSPGTYSCLCGDGFTGPACATEQAASVTAADAAGSACSPGCQNNSTCIEVYNSPGVYACQCLTGFTGLTCQTVIQRAVTAPTPTSGMPAEAHTKTQNHGLHAWVAVVIAAGAGVAMAAVVMGTVMYVLKRRQPKSFERFTDLTPLPVIKEVDETSSMV